MNSFHMDIYSTNLFIPQWFNLTLLLKLCNPIKYGNVIDILRLEEEE